MNLPARVALLAAPIAVILAAAPALAGDPAADAPAPLHAGAPADPGHRIARAIAAAVERRARSRMLEPVTTTGDRESLARLRGGAGVAVVRADLLRDAHAGTGRVDVPDPSLRALAVLHDDVVHIVARAGVASAADLRGRRVALGTRASGDPETARPVLAALGLAVSDLDARDLPHGEAADALAAGAIDAFIAPAPAPFEPVARALAAGGVLLPLPPSAAAEFADEGAYPRRTASIGPEVYPSLARGVTVVAIPAVLCSTEALPRGAAEDIVEALFAEVDDVRAAHPAAAAIDRARAAIPAPIPLHRGAALHYERAGPLDGPIEVKVLTWVYGISDIDVQHGTFAFNGTIDLRWQDPRLALDEGPLFEVMNEDAPVIEACVKDVWGGWRVAFTRVNGRLRAAYDLSRYPFDRQRLELQIEHPALGAGQLVYVPEVESEPALDLVRERFVEGARVADWELESVTCRRTVVAYGADERYSRYILAVEVRRNLLAFFLKDLVPIALMVVLSITAGFIPSDRIDAKLLLTVLALLVAVELQVAHSERFPETGHLTFGDWLYVLAYFAIAVGVVQSVVEYRLHAAGRDGDAARVRRAGIALAASVFTAPLAILAWRLG